MPTASASDHSIDVSHSDTFLRARQATRSCWLSIVGPYFVFFLFIFTCTHRDVTCVRIENIRPGSYLHVASVGHEAEFRSWCGALRTIQCTNCVLFSVVCVILCEKGCEGGHHQ